jgi:hypothetical protein
MSRTKFCPSCGCTKKRRDFYKSPKRADGLRGHCKLCVRQRNEASAKKCKARAATLP